MHSLGEGPRNKFPSKWLRTNSERLIRLFNNLTLNPLADQIGGLPEPVFTEDSAHTSYSYFSELRGISISGYFNYKLQVQYPKNRTEVTGFCPVAFAE